METVLRYNNIKITILIELYLYILQVGCGNNLKTPTYTDACGVECGDNSSCVVIDNTLKLQGKLAVHTSYRNNIDVNIIIGNSIRTIMIPLGAKDISIEGNSDKSFSNIG